MNSADQRDAAPAASSADLVLDSVPVSGATSAGWASALVSPDPIGPAVVVGAVAAEMSEPQCSCFSPTVPGMATS